MHRRNVVGLAVAAAAVGAVATPVRAQAQEAVITGRVVSDRGAQPVAGATVLITELGIGGLTNAQGNFTLTVPAGRARGQNATLLVRYIGFVAQRRPLTLAAGRQALTFTLVTDASRLTEVVVTGVTAATERVRAPFTVQKLDTADTPVVGTSAISQLQGKVPGANIVAATGRPGAAPSVLLRGPTSINAQGRSQQPLYIVDGLFLNGSIADVNPNDIESVEVLKGAAASNLYGERAGAGVISITTKSGKNSANGIKIGIKAEGGVGDIPRDFSIARRHILAMDPTSSLYCSTASTNGSSCTQLINLGAEVARVNEVTAASALPAQNFLNDGGIGRASPFGILTGQFQVNEFGETRNVLNQFVSSNGFGNSTVDVRGKVGSTGIYGSVSNLTQQGAIRHLGGFYRNSARANIDQRFGDRVTLSLNTFYAATRSQGDNQDFGGGNGFFRITRAPAFSDLTRRDALGRLYIRHNPLQQGEQNGNPLYDISNSAQQSKGQRFLGGSTLRYDPADWATIEGNFSFDRSSGDDRLLNDLGFRTTTPTPLTNNGSYSSSAGDDQSLNTSITGTVRRELFKDFRATLSGRYLLDQQFSTGIALSGSNLVVSGLSTANAITDQNSKSVGTSQASVRGVAYIGSTQLDYKDRYLIQANLRHGGSSLFGRDNRWATFPGLSGSWIVSREPWFPAGDAVSLLKFRAAYGEAGNRPNFTAQYATFAIGAGGLLVPATLGNPDLRPEVRKENEYGIEFELFKRLNGNVTYSNANIVNQIQPVPISVTSGFTTQWRNSGTLNNKSLEASLEMPWISRSQGSWSTRVIYSRLRSRITELNVAPYFTGTGLQATEAVFRIAQGEELGAIYGRDFVRRCGQLPAAFQSQCSGDGANASAAFRPNQDGYIVWVGAGNQINEGVTRNLWRAQLPGAQAPWGDRAQFVNQSSAYRLSWGMPILLRDDTGLPAVVSLGGSLPRYNVGFTNNVRYKKLTAYGLVDAAMGGRIWNQGYHWSLGDFMTGTADQSARSVEDARPVGYYWRAGPGTGGSTGVGGFYDALGPNGHTVEDASYAKLREVSLQYNVGRVFGAGNFTLGLVGRNLALWTKNYRGFDPEVGLAGGTFNNSALTGIDRFTYPNLRTVTFLVQTAF
jgi:TonB-linked SusC/RagA family outer membrane protein